MGNLTSLIALLFMGITSAMADQTTTFKKAPKEELTIVQTVSSNRRSFVISKGIKDGLQKGQEAIYANDNVSVVCKIIEVNRNFSLWAPLDPLITIPFKKDEIISYNSHAYGNVSLDIVGDVANLTPITNYNEEYKKFRYSNNIAAKVSYNKGLAQSSSDVSTTKNNSRSGYSLSAEYNYRFMPELEFSLGGRIDNEVYRLTDPELDIPTNRIMATAAVTYHLLNLTQNQNNLYVSLAAGIGKSTTTVDEQKATGIVTLLPEARVGWLMPISKTTAMVFEGSVESFSATEKFTDESEQTTNMLNFKVTVGLRF